MDDVCRRMKMQMDEENQNVFPDWTATSGIEFWHPDELYMEWQTFLYGIWENVQYL